MKKLLVAFAVAMLGIAVNAAAMDWGVQYSYDYNGNGNIDDGYRGTEQTYLVYLFDAVSYSLSNLNEAITKNTYKTDWEANKIDQATISGSAQSDGSFTASISSDAFTVQEGVASGLLVILNTDSLDTAQYAYIVAADANVPTSGVAGTFLWENADRDLTGMNTAANWTAVPEPTSGLLLLVGGALLALKRRRA